MFLQLKSIYSKNRYKITKNNEIGIEIEILKTVRTEIELTLLKLKYNSTLKRQINEYSLKHVSRLDFFGSKILFSPLFVEHCPAEITGVVPTHLGTVFALGHACHSYRLRTSNAWQRMPCRIAVLWSEYSRADTLQVNYNGFLNRYIKRKLTFNIEQIVELSHVWSCWSICRWCWGEPWRLSPKSHWCFPCSSYLTMNVYIGENTNEKFVLDSKRQVNIFLLLLHVQARWLSG